MGFTRAQLEAHRDATVDDLVGEGLRLLFVGINPGLWTAATNTHFARPGNRFYPALFRAGITDRLIATADGMSARDRDHLLARGVGITNLCPRATARADELDADELRAGAARVTAFVERHRPRVVAFAGITASRTAFGLPRAWVGRQPEPLGGAVRFVVPNPSGLNAHARLDDLAAAYAQAAQAAGVI